MEWNYGNGIAKMGGKKNLQLVCGNVIAEIGGKKKKLAIVAIPMPKMGWKKMLRSQYFYNIFTINYR